MTPGYPNTTSGASTCPWLDVQRASTNALGGLLVSGEGEPDPDGWASGQNGRVVTA